MTQKPFARLLFMSATALFLAANSYAARPGIEGKKLAQEGVELIKRSEPYVFEGASLKGATPGVYYRGFENPLQDYVGKWPTNVDPEIHTWGDYFYCRDAAMALMLIGMAQNQGNLAQQSDRKFSDYRRLRNKCYEASRKSPDQVTN